MCALSLCIFLTADARAFGIEPADYGTGSEHERITRAAITELEPVTLDTLAGKAPAIGAVGAPDVADSGLASDAPSHCLGEDVAPSTADERIEAIKIALTACRDLIVRELDSAGVAAKMLRRPTADDVKLDCRFEEVGGSAKCAVLRHLGHALHAAQDFYAHTNWADTPAPDAISWTNPAGFGRRTRAPWLDPAQKAEFPEGLLTGFGSRSTLSKDFGPIGRGQGGTGLTPRGAINGNFARAVAAAIDDTSDKWAYLKGRLREAYGMADGEMIICALIRDTFDPNVCTQWTRQATVCAARRALHVDGTKTDAPSVAEPTAVEISDAEAVYEELRPYCRLEEATLTRNAVTTGGTAEQGQALAKANAVAALALWNACPAEGRLRLDVFGGENDTDLRELDPTSPSARKRVRTLLTDIHADCIVAARLRQLAK